MRGRAAVAEMGETARLLIHFLRRPTLAIPRHPGPWLPVIPLLTIFGIDLLLDQLISLGLWSGEAAGIEPPTEIEVDWSSRAELLTLLVLAPVWEEIQFRGWLNGRRRNLICAAVLLPPLFLVMDFGGWVAGTLGEEVYQTIFTGTMLLAVLMGLWWVREQGDPQPVPPWFERHFAWILWGSTIAFGLIHTANYSDFNWGSDLLHVIPQTVGGLMLAFTRLRLGLRAAMVHHALFNGYWLLSDVWLLG